MSDYPVVLTNAVDNTTDVLAKHLNNLEAKVGIDSSAVTTSHDYKIAQLETGKSPIDNPTFTTNITTPSAIFPISSAGIALYNTADQVTNYERAVMSWSGNKLTIGAQRLGTGLDRQVDLVGNGGVFTINSSGTFDMNRSTGTSPISVINVGGTQTTSSGISKGISITGVYSGQTGTAGWTSLFINPTDTVGGSGIKNIIQTQLGGSDRFVVTSTGEGSFYSFGASNAISVGRNQNERLKLNVDDSNATITLLQDETATENHNMIFNIQSTASGTKSFIFQTNGVEIATLSKNGGVSFDGSVSSSGITTGTINSSSLTASEILGTDSSKNIISLPVATYPSLTELSYVKGVTSAIQTQLNSKQASGTYLTSSNIEDSIVDGHTTIAPSGNAVFNALALKATLISPSFTTPTIGGVAIPSISSTNVLTNKAITKRVVTTTDNSTAVIDWTTTDTYQLSAIANATTFTLTGTPTDSQKILIRFKDAGVAKALTWTGFTPIGVTLPTTTVAGKWHYIGIEYNSAASQTHVLAVGVED